MRFYRSVADAWAGVGADIKPRRIIPDGPVRWLPRCRVHHVIGACDACMRALVVSVGAMIEAYKPTKAEEARTARRARPKTVRSRKRKPEPTEPTQSALFALAAPEPKRGDPA